MINAKNLSLIWPNKYIGKFGAKVAIATNKPCVKGNEPTIVLYSDILIFNLYKIVFNINPEKIPFVIYKEKVLLCPIKCDEILAILYR